ncbi:hypothetical protein Micbo1qcDRAFT_151793 [Microdochium bolleyi]|uniref:Tyrosinase copper-binding domain-containing protein n=1 Tax=Microdochium bolleyi TaxID=196109 RepID=A0A136IS40_9PEZI|nr:hypothetical protein Micbo1qcDRAFT_151793 [Microdochium bolleyi]
MILPTLCLAYAALLAASPVDVLRRSLYPHEVRDIGDVGGTFPTMSFEEALELATHDKQSSELTESGTSSSGVAVADIPPPTTTSTLSSTVEGSSSNSEDDDESENRSSTPDRTTCPNPRIRVEWRNMADADKLSYVRAVRCLMDTPAKDNQIPKSAGTSMYAQLAWVHVAMAGTAHGTDMFLPWHRYYVLVFEKLLRDECGYRGPLPWWDETQDTGNFAGSGLFTDEYFGRLAQVKQGDLDPCIITGVSEGDNGTTSGECMTRGEHKETTAQAHWGWVELCEGMTRYSNMRECVEKGLHAVGHNGLGAVMANALHSVRDPVFFVHHSYVDWQWKRWQDKEPATRSTAVDGCTGPGTGGGGGAPDCTAPMGLDTVLSSQGLYPDLTVGDVLDTENYRICYRYDDSV